MKVILQESYMNLGEAGDVVDVKPGYARNYLVPQKLAVSATASNLRRFKDKAKEVQTRRDRERENARNIVEKLKDIKVVLKKKVSDDGRLFGSVNTKDIEEALVAQGAQVDRRQIVLGRQIKMMGDYTILVKLVGGFKANIPLRVESDKVERKLDLDDDYDQASATVEPRASSSDSTDDESSAASNSEG